MGSQPPTAPLRLAILEADTPMPAIQAKIGLYRSVFTSLFAAACAPLPLESVLDISGHDVVNDLESYPNPATVDAVLITGSKHNAFESDPWIEKLVAYTKQILEGGGKVIGVCFGHQIIGRAMGAQVGRSDKGWELSVVEMELTEEGKRIFGGETLKIHQMHRDVVMEHPAGTIPLAKTEACATQGMYIPNKMIAVQGHPEFNEFIMDTILRTRHDGGIIPDGPFEDAVSRAANDHHGVAIARAFVRFIRGEI